MQKQKYIAVFDSGLGGLTVLKELSQLLENENFLFYGDTKNMPYGNKTESQIIDFAKNDLDYINSFDLKAIVVGCNTIDSIAIDKLKDQYAVPIYRIIEPTCLQAVNISSNKKIAIMATGATIGSAAYQNTLKYLDNAVETTPISCHQFTELIEAGLKDSGQMDRAISEYIQPVINNNCDTLILGCTHYPIIKDKIHVLLPDVKIISSSYQCAINVKNNLKDLNVSKDKDLYFVSQYKKEFAQQAQILLNKDITIQEK